MDSKDFAVALGGGIAAGLSAVLSITILVLPVSWVMNRFVYHNGVMRVLLALATSAFSFVSFVIVLASCLYDKENKVHYFGLLPTRITGGVTEPTGYTAFITRVWNAVIHPFIIMAEGGTLSDPEDQHALTEAMKRFMVKTDTEGGYDPKALTDGEASAAAELFSKKPGDYGFTDVPPIVYKGAVYEPFFAATRVAGAQRDIGRWRVMMRDLQNTEIGKRLLG